MNQALPHRAHGTLQPKDESVITVYDLRPIENHFVIEDMQKLTSAYTKTISPEEFIRNSEIMYADKKEPLICLSQ